MKGKDDTGPRGHGDAEKRNKSSRRPMSASSRSPVPASPRPLVNSSLRFPVPASPNLNAHPSSFILHPSKRLGQNFLIDERIIDRIIATLEPQAAETIIEIGPGRGALTLQLVEKAGRVVAIEFDRKLVPLLRERFSSFQNFKLVEGDALTAEFCQEILPARRARLVANLPYNISTAILQRLLEQRHCLTDMVLMLQREVGDRIAARAGSRDRGFLSVLVEAYCETEKLFDVAPGSFRPAPKVWSSVVRLTFRPHRAVQDQDEKRLWQIVRAGFAQRRKTILNNLRNAPAALQDVIRDNGGASIVLCVAEIDLRRRAETLTLAEWARLNRAMY